MFGLALVLDRDLHPGETDLFWQISPLASLRPTMEYFQDCKGPGHYDTRCDPLWTSLTSWEAVCITSPTTWEDSKELQSYFGTQCQVNKTQAMKIPTWRRKKKNSRKNLYKIWDSKIRAIVQTTVIQDGLENIQRAESTFKEIMTENFWNLSRDTTIHI